MVSEQYDVAIVGGGAAGMTAGLYASRAGMRTVVLERLMPGGQVINAEKIENLPGFPEGVSGPDFAMLIQDQATRYGAEVELTEVSDLRRDEPFWSLACYGEEVRARAVILAGGSTLRRLGVPGEERLHGAGVSYCATCDGAFFADQAVAVVGGGDSALDEAAVLTEFASRVIVFHRRDSFRGQRVLQERVLSNPKVEVRWNTVVDAIIGEAQVEGVGTTDVAIRRAHARRPRRRLRLRGAGAQHRVPAERRRAGQRRARAHRHMDAHGEAGAVRGRRHPAGLGGAARQRRRATARRRP